MKTQTNTTKKNLKDFTVKELEALGITNTWKGHILAYQRLRLFETAKAKGLI